jgi:hypothetical protein
MEPGEYCVVITLRYVWEEKHSYDATDIFVYEVECDTPRHKVSLGVLNEADRRRRLVSAEIPEDAIYSLAFLSIEPN